MKLETKRLWIRTAIQEDVDDLLEMQNDEVILKYNCIKPMSREEMGKWLIELQKEENALHLEDKKSKKVIGSIFIEPDHLRHGINSLCLSYHINTQYAGKGLMSEAVNEVLRYCFEEKGCEIVIARVFVQNERSNKMLLRLGFTLEGTLKHAVKAYKDIIYDDNLYRMSKEEYNLR